MRKLQMFWQNLHLRAKFLLILLVGIVIIGVDAIATVTINETSIIGEIEVVNKSGG